MHVCNFYKIRIAVGRSKFKIKKEIGKERVNGGESKTNQVFVFLSHKLLALEYAIKFEVM